MILKILEQEFITIINEEGERIIVESKNGKLTVIKVPKVDLMNCSN